MFLTCPGNCGESLSLDHAVSRDSLSRRQAGCVPSPRIARKPCFINARTRPGASKRLRSSQSSHSERARRSAWKAQPGDGGTCSPLVPIPMRGQRASAREHEPGSRSSRSPRRTRAVSFVPTVALCTRRRVGPRDFLQCFADPIARHAVRRGKAHDMMPERWPALPYDAWKDTYATLHMWSQIVGKIALARAAPINHSWGDCVRCHSARLDHTHAAARRSLLPCRVRLHRSSARDRNVRRRPANAAAGAANRRRFLPRGDGNAARHGASGDDLADAGGGSRSDPVQRGHCPPFVRPIVREPILAHPSADPGVH